MQTCGHQRNHGRTSPSKEVRKVILVLLSVLAAGCGIAASNESLAQTMTHKEFQKLPYFERRALINELALDARVHAYLDMVIEQRPPDLALASRIAPAGHELVEATWRVLAGEGDELRFSDGVFLLRVVQDRGYASVRENRALLRFLEERIDAMEASLTREWSAELLEQIAEERLH